MRRFLGFSLIAVLLVGVNTQAHAERHRMGAIRETVLPAWIHPSPPIVYNGESHELDESCDNSAGLPPVGNQSSQGSCTAWASGYYYLTYLQGQDNPDWDLSDPSHQMSPAFVYNQINGGEDSGSMPSDAFLLFENEGCAPMSDMPYVVGNCTDFPSETAFRDAMPNRTLSTMQINTHTEAGLQDLKNLLLNGDIAMTAITVWDNFQNIRSFNNTYCVSEIYGDQPGGHAVAIVGFDDSLQTSDGMGALRMVNSWGTSWGESGFWWMSYQALMDPQIGWGYALYAVDREDYQPTLIARISAAHTDRYNLTYRMGVGESTSPAQTVDFFDFAMNARQQIAYPMGGTFDLDLTDFVPDIDEQNPNNLFLQVQDHGGNNGATGTVNSFRAQDLSRDFTAYSTETPLDIPDQNTPVTANLVFYYAAVPPVNLTSSLDLSTGQVVVNWENPQGQGLDEFVEYIVRRNGLEIGTTTGTTMADTLDRYGVYHYTVTSSWDECNSVQSEPTTVNYIAPVAPTYAGVMSVDGLTGDYTLAWEQQREDAITYDDGFPEGSYYFNRSAQPGAMIAQRVTVGDDGLILKMAGYFSPTHVAPMGPVRYVVMADNGGDVPGDVLFRSQSFVPERTGWNWMDLDANHVRLHAGDRVWVAVAWDEMMSSPLGRDTSQPNPESMALSPDGSTWTEVPNGGVPMIRLRYGVQEVVDGWTGLLGFNVYRDGELIGTVNSDDHQYEGELPGSGSYLFRIDAVYQQEVVPGDTVAFEWDGTSGLGVPEQAPQPLAWRLAAAYPNPFNPTTTVTVEMPEAANLTVNVFNLLGQKVAVLANGRLERGVHRFVFDASNLSSGTYFVRATVPGKLQEMRKVLLVR